MKRAQVERLNMSRETELEVQLDAANAALALRAAALRAVRAERAELAEALCSLVEWGEASLGSDGQWGSEVLDKARVVLAKVSP